MKLVLSAPSYKHPNADATIPGNPFTNKHFDFLSAVQAEGGLRLRRKGDASKLRWPSKFTSFSGDLYRGIHLTPVGGTRRNGWEYPIGKPIKHVYWSSWTTDKQFAINWRQSSFHYRIADTYFVVLQMKPPESLPLLNIAALYRDKQFLEAKAFYERGGIGLEIGDEQNEVYVGPVTVPWSSVIYEFEN